MKIKKLFATIAACALLAVSLCALTACADNSKEVITNSLEQELDSLKNPDEATISTLTSQIPASTLSQLGLTSDELIKALLEGFDGKIDNVEVNGSNAEAVVTISCKDFSQLASSIQEVTNAAMKDPTKFQGMSTSEISKWMGDQIITKINELPVVAHDPTTIEYELKGNTWEPAAGAQAKLTSVLFG